jgi:predicted nucleic acid-binding protein
VHESLRGKALIISDFAIAEFSSVVARRTRAREINHSGAASVFAALDVWTLKATRRETLTAGDVNVALSLVRRLKLRSRATDAVNIAIAQRCAATLLTFDDKMARSARSLGMSGGGLLPIQASRVCQIIVLK